MPRIVVHEAVQIGGKVVAPGEHNIAADVLAALHANGRGHLIALIEAEDGEALAEAEGGEADPNAPTQPGRPRARRAAGGEA